jgi:ABC-type transporter Mla subunit MlaD
MSEDLFRIVITVAVALASLAFLVQAFVVIGLYRAARKMQEKVESLTGRAEPLIAKAGPVIDRIGPVVDSMKPVIAKIGTVVEKAGPVVERVPALMDKAAPVVEHVGRISAEAATFLATANEVLQENRPHIGEITLDAAGIARSGREQVERIGDLLHDASDRARTRIEQIDETVGSTVEHVGEVGENVKHAVMRPVREINGIAAGISAAVSTLVKGRKSSVDSATQDEEMFI